MIRRESSPILSKYSKSCKSTGQIEPQELIRVQKKICCKKSFFSPSPSLAQHFKKRSLITTINVPQIQILHSSKRWLLLQTSRYTHSFFNRLRSDQFYNRFDQLLKIFHQFQNLASIYGYFRPTEKMIFVQDGQFKVWIHEDPFSLHRMLPIQEGRNAENAMVLAFCQMINYHLRLKQSLSAGTTEELQRILEMKLNGQKKELIKASQDVLYRMNQSLDSFNEQQLGYYSKKLAICRSQQQIQNNPLEDLQSILANSVTIKDINQKKGLISSVYLLNKLADTKTLKKSVYQENNNENDFRKTKKKFALDDTWSSIKIFSQGRRTFDRKRQRSTKHQIQDRQQLSEVKIQKQKASIQTELNGLFSQEESQSIDYDDNNQELQKIVEEMEEALIW